jgi:hypothetical protein
VCLGMVVWNIISNFKKPWFQEFIN